MDAAPVATGASGESESTAATLPRPYREVTPQERLVQTFEWEGMPGHVIVETTTFEELGDGRTKVITTRCSTPTEERDGMLAIGHGGRHERDLPAPRRAARPARRRLTRRRI